MAREQLRAALSPQTAFGRSRACLRMGIAAPEGAGPYTQFQSQRDWVLQPSVARNELPWVRNARLALTLKGLRPLGAPMEHRCNPFGVGARLGRISQGSSSLATLGFEVESLGIHFCNPKDACKVQQEGRTPAFKTEGYAGPWPGPDSNLKLRAVWHRARLCCC